MKTRYRAEGWIRAVLRVLERLVWRLALLCMADFARLRLERDLTARQAALNFANHKRHVHYVASRGDSGATHGLDIFLVGGGNSAGQRPGAAIVVARSVRKVEIGAHCLHLDGDDIIQARTIYLAIGVSRRSLNIEDCDRFAGKG